MNAVEHCMQASAKGEHLPTCLHSCYLFVHPQYHPLSKKMQEQNRSLLTMMSWEQQLGPRLQQDWELKQVAQEGLGASAPFPVAMRHQRCTGALGWPGSALRHIAQLHELLVQIGATDSVQACDQQPGSASNPYPPRIRQQQTSLHRRRSNQPIQVPCEQTHWQLWNEEQTTKACSCPADQSMF